MMPDSCFHPNSSIGYLVRRVYQLSQEALEPIFAAERLTGTQWSTLAVVLSGHRLTCAEVARDLAHDRGAMTRIIDQLSERNLITRERDANDRRHVKLTLTAEGEAVTIRVRDQVVAAWRGWLGDWDEANAGQLIASLQRLQATLAVAERKPA